MSKRLQKCDLKASRISRYVNCKEVTIREHEMVVQIHFHVRKQKKNCTFRNQSKQNSFHMNKLVQ